MSTTEPQTKPLIGQSRSNVGLGGKIGTELRAAFALNPGCIGDEDKICDALVELREMIEKIERLNDVEAVAHRLALELECLLLDTKDLSVQSRWWDSAHVALEQWRALDQQPHVSALGMD